MNAFGTFSFALDKESGYRFRYIELINEVLSALDTLSLFRECDSKADMIGLIRTKLEEASGELRDIQKKLNHDDFTIIEYEKIQKSFSFQRLTQDFFDRFNEVISEGISRLESLDALDDTDMDLTTFCAEQGLGENSRKISIKVEKDEFDVEDDYISISVLGDGERDERFDKSRFDRMVAVVNEAAGGIIADESKAEILLRGSRKFELYFENVRLKGDAFKAKTLAVIDDLTRTDSDLFITCDGVVPVKRGKVDRLRRFDRIEYRGKSIKLGWPDEYSNAAVNPGNLYALLETLKKIRGR